MPQILATHYQDIGEFVTELYQAQNIDEAFCAFEKQVFKLGFEGVLYTFIPRISLQTDLPTAPVYKVSDSFSPQYLTHYMEDNFYRHDPAVKAIEQGQLTTIDWWLEVKKGTMSHAEKSVIITAREDYQVINGLTIPTLSDNRGIAGASFISSDNDYLFQQLKSISFDQLQLCTQLFHAAIVSNAFLSHSFIKPLIPKLNSKEKQLLRGLSVGESMIDIADKLDISVKYLDKVLRRTREKFSGVGIDEETKINRNQLIYHLGLLNILDNI